MRVAISVANLCVGDRRKDGAKHRHDDEDEDTATMPEDYHK
jgi:hypothetical protein